MSNKSIKQPHPLRRAGIQRIDRMVKAIMPDYYKLDDQSIQDLLVAAHRYSAMLSWFDQEDRPDGNWTCFWETETLTYLAVLAATDLEQLRKDYDDADYRLGEILEGKHTPAKKNELSKAGYRQLLETLFRMAKGLEESYRKLVAIRHPLQKKLLGLIKKVNIRDTEEIGGTLRQLIGLHKGMDDKLKENNIYSIFIHADNRWSLVDEEDYGRIGAKVAIVAPREQLRSIFIRLYNTYTYLKHAAQRAFDEELLRMEKPENEEYRIVQPHISLFIAFLRLFKHAQDSLNGLVGKQLDFYYEQVLGLRRAPAVPDTVYLIFTLAKNFEPQLVTKGTQLFGGKEKLYETVENWAVSQAQIEEVKSFFLPSKTFQFFYDTSADLRLNYKTVIGKNYPLPLSEPGIRMFSDEPDRDIEEQEVGFVIASPQLLLQEGKRLIEVTFEGLSALVTDEIIEVALSTEKGWEKIERSIDNTLNGQTSATALTIEGQACYCLPSGSQTLKIFLPKDFSPVIANPQLGTTKKWPGLKVSLKKAAELVDNSKNPLARLGDGGYNNLIKPITRIIINVRAEGVSKNLILQTDLGAFDGTQQLLPFGPTAQYGARFYIGFAEALMKKEVKITIKPNWLDPKSDTEIGSYYSVYNANAVNALSREIVVENLNGGEFDELSDSDTIKFDNSTSLVANLSLDRDIISDTSFKQFDPSVKKGFIRITFKGELGHKEFPNILAILSKSADAVKQLPNPPYTPTINSLELDYYSLLQEMKDGADEFYFIHPFEGYEHSFFKSSTLFKDFIGPELFQLGHLYLGLSQLPPSSNLSILFHTVEGTEQDTSRNVPDIQWSCLEKDNQWKNIEPDKILSDSTDGLTRTGIIQIAIPDSISSEGNTILNPKLLWLRACAIIKEDALTSIGAFPNLSYIHAQAITARFIDKNTNDYSHMADGLPAQSIGKLIESRSSIKKVEQPYASFGGRAPEAAGTAFYIRISERLRHRDRAVTVWDYERLLLEAFPAIAAVKCIPHTAYNNLTPSEWTPGSVTVAVIPDITNRTGLALLEPRFAKGDLDEMRKFLLERSTLFLGEHLEVINPQYERIKIETAVKFKDGVDKALCTIQLKKDLRHFLSPWLNGGAPPAFGKMLRRSEVIQFIESRDYIDYVEVKTIMGQIPDLKPDIYKDGTVIEQEYIKPGAAHGILCSILSGKHGITDLQP